MHLDVDRIQYRATGILTAECFMMDGQFISLHDDSRLDGLTLNSAQLQD